MAGTRRGCAGGRGGVHGVGAHRPLLKPVEYAAAGIRRFWRVEPDGTVLQFRLDGAGYAQVGAVALDDLLAGEVPDLS